MVPTVIFDNKEVSVVEKPRGISVDDFADELSEYYERKVYLLHRLDTAVGGIMVFAKNKESAEFINRQIRENTFKKTYYATVFGETNESGEYSDYLFKDSSKNKSFVVKKMRKGVREANLSYKTLGVREYNGDKLSLVKIGLLTGRTHQIRVQFSFHKHPLVGDGKYGSTIKNKNIALWSYSLSFVLPGEKEKTDFFIPYPTEFPFNLFN